MGRAAKYKDIELHITHYGPDKDGAGNPVGWNVYDVTFHSVWPIRGPEKMPPPGPEAIAKHVAKSLAEFLPGSYEIDYCVVERSVPASDSEYGKVGEPVAKNFIESMYGPPGHAE